MKFIYEEGTCILRKARTINIGSKNQYKLDLVFIASVSVNIEINDKI